MTVLSTAPHGGGVQEGGGHGGVGEGHPLQLLGHGGGHGDTCVELVLNCLVLRIITTGTFSKDVFSQGAVK